MVFAILAGFLAALVASRYVGESDSRMSTELMRSRLSKP
jgi:TRAP-type C4-dicarboxylate transport system permease small subunit